MANEGPVYELVNGPNACDICTAMAGLYPTPPDVPIHVKCECTVEMVDPEDPDGVTYEVRNVQWDEESWTEEINGALVNCANPAFTSTLTLGDVVAPLEHFDPGVEDAAEEAGWEKPEAQGITGDVEMPADSELEFTVTATYVSVIFTGELWRVRAVEDPVAGVLTEEEMVDEVGGLYEALVEAELTDHSFEPCTDDPDPDDGYFQDGDESPWRENDPREIEV